MFFHYNGHLSAAQLRQIELIEKGMDRGSPATIIEYEHCTGVSIPDDSPKVHVVRHLFNQYALTPSEHPGELSKDGSCPVDTPHNEPIYVQGQGSKLLPWLEEFSQHRIKDNLSGVVLEIHNECDSGCITVWSKNPADTRALLRYLGEVGFQAYLIHRQEPETVNVRGKSVCSYH